MKKLSQRDKKVLVIGSVLTGVVLLVFLVVLPFADAQAEAQTRLDQRKMLLMRSLTTTRERQIYQDRLSELDRALAGFEGRLLQAPNANIAETRLLEILTDLAEENGVAITRSNPVPDKQEGNFTKVTLQVNLDCGIIELAGFLRSIAQHSRFLSVEQFNLNIGRSRRQRTKLRPRIRVAGFIRPS